MELRNFLVQKYPQLQGAVEGAHFPAPPVAGTIAAATQIMQMLAIPMLWFGDSLLSSIGMEMPAWFVENKMQVFLALFVANTFAQNMAQTGAFEIEVDGNIIFSKMKEKRMPRIDEIVQGLKRLGIE